MKQTLLIFILSLVSLHADTFELKGGDRVDINVTNQDTHTIQALYKNKPKIIDSYNKVCIINKYVNKSIYININSSISLNLNNLCHTKINKPAIEDSLTIATLLKKIKNTQQSIETFFTSLTFTQKDLRIKKYAEASGDETIPLKISKSKTPIFTFQFESPQNVQLILWGETLEATKLEQHQILISKLESGKYGLALETNKGKKIMEFEVTIVE